MSSTLLFRLLSTGPERGAASARMSMRPDPSVCLAEDGASGVFSVRALSEKSTLLSLR